MLNLILFQEFSRVQIQKFQVPKKSEFSQCTCSKKLFFEQKPFHAFVQKVNDNIFHLLFNITIKFQELSRSSWIKLIFKEFSRAREEYFKILELFQEFQEQCKPCHFLAVNVITLLSDVQGEAAIYSSKFSHNFYNKLFFKKLWSEVLTGPCDVDWFSRLPPRCTRCILGNGNEGEGRIGGKTGVMTSSGSLLSCDTNAWKKCSLSIILWKERCPN